MARLLVLGGTAEARTLAGILTAREDLEVISSLAGRVREPRLPAGSVRSGGFGGIEAMATWLVDNGIDMVIDATHPFASTITAHADRACAQKRVPLVCLVRSAWTATSADRWITVPSVTEAARATADLTALPGPNPVFLTVGRGGVGAFANLDGPVIVRCIDPPEVPLPPHWTVILDRGPFDLDTERELMVRHGVGVLVTKNSGGQMTRAKVDAAATLGVRVVMIDRPELPANRPTVATAEEAAAAVREVLSSRSDGR